LSARSIVEFFTKKPDKYPEYSDKAQRFNKGFLPEPIEMELHKILPENEAEKLDKGFIDGNLLQYRSAYMAGYLDSIAREMAGKTNKTITFACGGMHLPRVASLLKENSAYLPPSLKKHFDNGVKAANQSILKYRYLTAYSHLSNEVSSPSPDLQPGAYAIAGPQQSKQQSTETGQENQGSAHNQQIVEPSPTESPTVPTAQPTPESERNDPSIPMAAAKLMPVESEQESAPESEPSQKVRTVGFTGKLPKRHDPNASFADRHRNAEPSNEITGRL
ncbi:MAG: hypothetical protein AAF195_02800, partial [Pseudomonadota bacterium]